MIEYWFSLLLDDIDGILSLFYTSTNASLLFDLPVGAPVMQPCLAPFLAVDPVFMLLKRVTVQAWNNTTRCTTHRVITLHIVTPLAKGTIFKIRVLKSSLGISGVLMNKYATRPFCRLV